MDAAGIWRRWKVWWLSASTGAIFGCVLRLIVATKLADSLSPLGIQIIGIAFLAVMPFAMGYLSVRIYLARTPTEAVRWFAWLFLPWASMAITIVVCLLFVLEGAICLLFAGPIMLIFALLGGVAARIAWGQFGRRSPGTLSAFALPLLLMTVESRIPSHYEIRQVDTEILIHAPAGAVWENIKSVRAIAPAELPGSWVGKIGFPRPIAATLSHEGIGGVRQASFTGGLVFTETVNLWQPQNDLRFSIRANTASIPRGTLDEHVTIGGAFFDVLDGEYRLEPRPDGILLHLSSRERLSTHLNPYAALWTDAVMRSIQREILAVIRNRCERQRTAFQAKQ